MVVLFCQRRLKVHLQLLLTALWEIFESSVVQDMEREYPAKEGWCKMLGTIGLNMLASGTDCGVLEVVLVPSLRGRQYIYHWVVMLPTRA